MHFIPQYLIRFLIALIHLFWVDTRWRRREDCSYDGFKRFQERQDNEERYKD